MTVIGDARRLPFADGVAQMCVTSPPYYGLRDYGIAGQIGLEQTPAAYVAELVATFREVRRVLRDDGVLWLNIGDSYANDEKWGGYTGGKHANGLHGANGLGRARKNTGLKPKDLLGIPWRVAFALQDDGWYLRSDIIWHKPNPMPESVTDRPTKAHEYVFLLAKSARYFYDADAVKETGTTSGKQNSFARKANTCPSPVSPMQHRLDREDIEYSGTRNARTVWTIATRPYSGAHFATMPPALAERCILAGSRRGDIVLDPFSGSGTTERVAIGLGRRFIGTELNPAYIGLRSERVAAVQVRGL